MSSPTEPGTPQGVSEPTSSSTSMPARTARPTHIPIPASPHTVQPALASPAASSSASEGSKGIGLAPNLTSSAARMFPIRSVAYPSGSKQRRTSSTDTASATDAPSGPPQSPSGNIYIGSGPSISSLSSPPISPTSPGGRGMHLSLDPFLSEPTMQARKEAEQAAVAAPNAAAGFGGASARPAGLPGTPLAGDDKTEAPSPGDQSSTTGLGGGTSVQGGDFIMTTRFEHAETKEGGIWVLTGRDGKLERCEDEPIHVPGAVQAFGMLVAFDEDESGNLVVCQVSENCRQIVGISPPEFFRAKCMTKFLDEDEKETLIEAIEALEERDLDPNNTETAPMNFTLSGLGMPGTGHSTSASASSTDRLDWICHCAIHRPDPVRKPKRFVIEMEPVEDLVNPVKVTPEESMEDRGGMERYGGEENPSEEDILESTVSLTQPLRALARYKSKVKRTNKRRRRSDDDSLDVVSLLTQINEQLSKTDDLETFLKIVAGIFKEVTEFDRSMIYQFDEQWNGRVVAEQVDWTRTNDLFRGLNFPASDIPAQARELYKINKVRLLYDRDQPTARMCCRSIDEVENPLNMTHCHLRAMSPIHVKYLGNMGVRSSMSISILAFGNLWGLVSLHTYGRFGQRVTFPIRQLCKLLGDSISRNIERLSYAKRLHGRKLINTAPTSKNPSGYIVARAEDLLTLFDADFGVLSIGDEAKILGSVANSQELLAVLEYLRARRFTEMRICQDIATDFPDIDYPEGFQLIAGLLCVPLSSEGRDFIVFFRKGQLQEVHWAGNPYANKDPTSATYQPLEPRTSFKTWSETVVGKCRPWSDEQLETAGVLCLVYGKFIDVWRQKENALAANQLTNLLLANASHEVRTPLNAIINYLELALDGEVDGEVRENLARSHAASRSLIHVINDLLDLTRTERGQDLFLQDPFDLATTIQEAIQIHKVEAERQGLTLDVVENPTGTPSVLLGDRAKIRQVISNVVANAVKHTKEGSVMIEWGELSDQNLDDALEGRKDSIRVGISITDTGVGISEERLESLFREFSEVTSTEDGDRAVAGPTVGLGLALVARIVSNLEGQLRVESKEGEGSKFTLVLPFRLPSLNNTVNPGSTGGAGAEGSGTASSRTLSASGSTALTRTRSQGSGGSVRSKGSSTRSDIDSLINAMSSSHMDPGRHKSPTASVSSGGSIRHRKLRPVPQKKELAGSAPVDPQGEVTIEDSAVPLRPVKIEGLEDGPDVATSSRIERRASLKSIMSRSSADGSPAISSPPHSPPLETTPSFNLTRSPSITLPTPPTQQQIMSPTMHSPGSPGVQHITEWQRTRPKPTGKETPMRVLVVEDELVNRMIIEKRLKMKGHDVVTAVHGKEALRLLAEDNKFDIVLMDLSMPILNGYECSVGIRELEAALKLPSPEAGAPLSIVLNGRIPILAVSASLRERQRSQLQQSFIDGWLLKPVDFQRLSTLMRGALDTYQRNLDLYQPGNWERGGWLAPAGSVPSPSAKKMEP
ncbi:hypothetical protein T439DRAFT_329151 [Meredithblackwellia eburnea MCA 4105]